MRGAVLCGAASAETSVLFYSILFYSIASRAERANLPRRGTAVEQGRVCDREELPAADSVHPIRALHPGSVDGVGIDRERFGVRQHEGGGRPEEE